MGTLTVYAVELMGIAKLADLARKRLCSIIAGGHGWEVFTVRASTDGHESLDVWIFSLQFCESCKTAGFPIDLLARVSPVVDRLQKGQQLVIIIIRIDRGTSFVVGLAYLKGAIFADANLALVSVMVKFQ